MVMMMARMKLMRFEAFTNKELQSMRQAMEAYKASYGDYEGVTVSTSVMDKLVAEIEEELRTKIPTLGENDE
jgi:hypothetical protein